MDDDNDNEYSSDEEEVQIINNEDTDQSATEGLQNLQTRKCNLQMSR